MSLFIKNQNTNSIKKSLHIMNLLFYIILFLIVIISLYILYQIFFSSKKILLEDNLVLNAGETHKLKVGSNDVFLESNNNEIALVLDDGTIYAINVGEAVITAKTSSGKTATCNVTVKGIAITNLELSKNDINLNKGDTVVLESIITPSDSTDKKIIWESSDSNVVSVVNGRVKALNSGTAVITAKTNNGKTATCNVTVQTLVTDIKLNYSSVNLIKNDSINLIATIVPNDADDKTITWENSNPSIASNNNGELKGLTPGTTTITVKTNNGKTATCNVTVKEASVTSIKLNYSSVNINMGYYLALKATVFPDNAENKTITWKSSDTSIATVDNDGKVVPKSSGTVTITATANNGVSASAQITIDSPTKNKTALFVGDSITMGKYDNYSWATYIGKHYDLKSVVNAGLSGGVLSTVRGEKWLPDVVKQYAKKKFDYVILHGGINDIAMSGVAIGSYNSKDFSGKYATDTLLGGLEYYIYLAKKQWPNAKIGYIINYKTPLDPNVNARSSECYSKMIKVLKKWNIGYINLYSGKTASGQSYSDLLQVNTKKYIQDGDHLNKAGYNLISPHIYNWMLTL